MQSDVMFFRVASVLPLSLILPIYFSDVALARSQRSFSVAAERVERSVESPQGSAADLGDIPPVGWPLGAPLTCRAMTDQLALSLRAATEKLRAYCNEQNEKMLAAGYKTCAVNECLDSAITRDGGYDHGKFTLRIYRSIRTGEPVLTLTYNYPANVAASGTFPVCFDPASRSQELLNDEFAMWDFRRFVEFCAARPESRPETPPS